MSAFEFKWKTGKRVVAPANFINNYSEATFSVVTPDNYQDFLNGV